MLELCESIKFRFKRFQNVGTSIKYSEQQTYTLILSRSNEAYTKKNEVIREHARIFKLK